MAGLFDLPPVGRLAAILAAALLTAISGPAVAAESGLAPAPSASPGQPQVEGSGFRILSHARGTEIELVGHMTAGVADAMAGVLAKSPRAAILHLNSFGGLVIEGRKLFGLIRERGLVTYASAWCYSACTDAFLGGRERWLARSARLGFHRPAAPGAGAGEIAAAMGAESAFLTGAGVPVEFVRKAHATPNESMWLPTIDELLDAGIITGVTESSRFAPTGIGDTPTAEHVGDALTKLGFFDSIRRLDPATFAAIRELWLAGLSGEPGVAQIAAETQRHIEQLIARHIGAASDDAAIEYAMTLLAEVETVGSIRPELCGALLTAHADETIEEAWSLFPIDLQQRESDALEGVFTSAALGSQPPPSRRQVAGSFGRVNEALSKRYGDQALLLGRATIAQADRAAACEVFVAFLEEILALERSESSRMIRYMFGDAAEGPASAPSDNQADLVRFVPGPAQRK